MPFERRAAGTRLPRLRWLPVRVDAPRWAWSWPRGR